MKRFIIILLIAGVFISCLDNEILLPDEFYTKNFPVKVPTDSSWIAEVQLKTKFPFPKDSLNLNEYQYIPVFNTREYAGSLEGLTLVEEVDFSDIIYFQIDSVYVKTMNFTWSLYFNSSKLKALLHSENNKAKSLYGPKSGAGISVTMKNPKGDSFVHSFSITGQNGSLINVDLMPDNTLIKYEDLCPYFVNQGTLNECPIGYLDVGILQKNYSLNERFIFSFNSIYGIYNGKVDAYYLKGREYKADLIELSKKQ